MRRTFALMFTLALLVGTLAVVSPAAATPVAEPVTIAGFFSGPQAEALVAELEAFAKGRYEIDYHETDWPELADWVMSEDPPDIIVNPQPAWLTEHAPYLVDVGSMVNDTSLRRDFGDYLIDVASVDDTAVGFPIALDLKSLVWYQPAEFDAMGYSIPTSFAELVALSDMMVANGDTPWCNYIGSGSATGWLGTDWIEDLVLSTEGPVVYDQWVDHTVVFRDPRIEAAFQRYEQMMDTPGYVFDRPNMTSLFFFENAGPLGLGDCLMHRQASFFAGFIPGFGFDLDDFATFPFPPVDPEFGDATVGSGNYAAATTERKEVRELIRFMASHKFGRAVLSGEPGWIMANVRFDTTRYTDGMTREWAESVQAAVGAGVFRFDASDLMPPEIGAGEFWFGVTDLADGTRTIPQVLADIDAAWPS